ncbi:MAG: ABC transporter permease [Nitrospirota bacterium]
MGRYVLRRCLLAVPVVLGVATLVFLLIHLIPGDPVDLMLGETAREADKTQLRRELRLDRPLAEQYGTFLAGLARGDLGRSLHTRQPVLETIAQRLPATAELALAALLFACALALPLGVLSAVRRNSGWDYGALSLALLGAAMPNFWLGPLLIMGFALALDWLPVSGRDGMSAVILPAVTLGSGMAAILMRMTRASLLDVLGQDHLVVARAKGLAPSRVLLRHGLRPALLPVLTLIGLQLGALLAGAIVTETIFAWPGVGRLTVQAILSRDYPLAQGCVLAIAVGYVLVNLLTDWLYAAVDPRIRDGR